MNRRCNRCGIDRPPTEFYVSKGRVNYWCKSCYRDWYQSRGGYQGRRETECEWCGAELVTPYHRTRFCSRTCKDAAKNRARQDAINAAKPDRRCAWCGVGLPRTMRSDARFCSDRCNMLAHRATRNYRRRMGKTAPLKPRKEPLINFSEIAERDGWRCGICGGAVTKDRQWPDPLAASLDHVVRLSENGTNEPENLRLAHYRCNSSRH